MLTSGLLHWDRSGAARRLDTALWAVVAMSLLCSATTATPPGEVSPLRVRPAAWDEEPHRRWNGTSAWDGSGGQAYTSRKTLMQWSYGTSFEGGPPSRDEPLVTDRPDFTEASTTVGMGVAQVEYGYTYLFDREAGERTIAHSYPEMLWRIGMLADWFEFRIAWNYAEERIATGGVETRARGAEDLYLGIKLGLTPQEGILPEMALVPQMTVPTGARAFTSGETMPGINWLYSWEVNDWLTIGGSSQINRAVDDAGAFYSEFAQSMTAAYTLTDRLGAYTEWFALFPSGAAAAEQQHFFNGGFTYLLNNDQQIDIRAGVGLNRAAEDYFLGVGHSVRF